MHYSSSTLHHSILIGDQYSPPLGLLLHIILYLGCVCLLIINRHLSNKQHVGSGHTYRLQRGNGGARISISKMQWRQAKGIDTYHCTADSDGQGLEDSSSDISQVLSGQTLGFITIIHTMHMIKAYDMIIFAQHLKLVVQVLTAYQGPSSNNRLAPDPSLQLHLKVQKTNCPENCAASVLAWARYSFSLCQIVMYQDFYLKNWTSIDQL